MNCNECKELFVEYIDGLLEEAQKQAVSEHLTSCRTCKDEFDEMTSLQDRLVKNGTTVSKSNLENKVMDMIVREQNVKLKAAEKAGSTFKLRSIFMKNPKVKLAAAAIIIFAVLIGINLFSPSITFAQVIEPILNARTIIFDMILGADESGMVTHETVVDSRIRRTVSTLPNMAMIIDMDDAKMLTLETDAKTAFFADISGDLGDMTRSYIKFVRQIIGQLQDGQVKQLDEQIIDGQKAIGFRSEGQNEQVTIWADPRTALPIRIDVHIGQELAFTMKNFEFNAQVDESLMSMEIPNGYVLKETEINMNATEEDFVESLRIWAEVIRDGSFPDAIGTQNAMEQMTVLIEKIGQMNIPEEEATKLGVAYGKGMLFHQILETRGSWHYAGSGVNFGDADTPIFWYQPEGSSTYRVIYGDLHVEDVSPENLPQ